MREIAEETGLIVALGAPLGVVEYDLPGGKPKVVYYWAAETDAHAIANSTFVSNDEIEQLDLAEPQEGTRSASYPHDVDIVDRFAELAAQGRRTHVRDHRPAARQSHSAGRLAGTRRHPPAPPARRDAGAQHRPGHRGLPARDPHLVDGRAVHDHTRRDRPGHGARHRPKRRHQSGCLHLTRNRRDGARRDPARRARDDRVLQPRAGASADHRRRRARDRHSRQRAPPSCGGASRPGTTRCCTFPSTTPRPGSSPSRSTARPSKAFEHSLPPPRRSFGGR